MNHHSPRTTASKAAGKSAAKATKNGRRKSAPANGTAASGKRERILDAAVRVFAKSGFYNAKVSQIAHAAGVADGTIYLYFKSKDELLIHLFEDGMERINSGLRTALERESNPLTRL